MRHFHQIATREHGVTAAYSFVKQALQAAGFRARGRHRQRREASYYLWRSKFGAMSVSDAKRVKEVETENTRLKKLLAESLLENEVTREVLRKKW